MKLKKTRLNGIKRYEMELKGLKWNEKVWNKKVWSGINRNEMEWKENEMEWRGMNWNEIE